MVMFKVLLLMKEKENYFLSLSISTKNGNIYK